MLWFQKIPELSQFNDLNKNTLGEYLGLHFTEVGDDYVKAILPVDHRTQQPYGILHGGASCVLAETLGSAASAFVVDHANYMTLGIEINANHLCSVKSGIVTGICKPIHIGSTLHVWEIRITDEQEKLICVSRLTVFVRKR